MDAGRRVTALVEEGLGNSSFLVDAGDGAGLVVDPRRDVDVYLDLAAERGLRVEAIFETHLHADFVSGAPALAERTGARAYVPAGAEVAWGAVELVDGTSVRVGASDVRAVATPGHTPEHTSYVLERDGVPEAVFAGGAVMPGGGVSRTDLIAPESTEALARAALASARALLDTLPGAARILPTHGPGSFCSTGGDRRRETTVADERAEPFWSLEPEAFVAELTARYGPYPPYFSRLRTVNRAARGEPPAPPRLSAGELAKEIAAGAVVVDARPVDRWSAAHVDGSISIAVRPQFGVWLGWVVPWGSRIALVAGDEAEATEAVRQALGIGYDGIAGTSLAGAAEWREAGIGVASVRQVEPREAAASLEAGWRALDVREPSEVAAGTIPGSERVPLGRLAGQARPPGGVVAFCGHGERSATALSLLERAGHRRLANLRGGFAAWRRAGLPVG